MKTIAIMNYKGGVGKTVTTINFAAELAAAGKRVIVMDADGQCNLSDIFRADTLHGGTTYEVLTGETGCCWDELVQDTPVDGVKIVPASAELPKADIAALTGERLAKTASVIFASQWQRMRAQTISSSTARPPTMRPRWRRWALQMRSSFPSSWRVFRSTARARSAVRSPTCARSIRGCVSRAR